MTDMDELMNAEFKEAFDEFDKVKHCSSSLKTFIYRLFHKTLLKSSLEMHYLGKVVWNGQYDGLWKICQRTVFNSAWRKRGTNVFVIQ